MEKRTVYVYDKETLAKEIYEASNYSLQTEIVFGTSAFSVLVNGGRLDNKTATKISNRVAKSATKLWRTLK